MDNGLDLDYCNIVDYCNAPWKGCVTMVAQERAIISLVVWRKYRKSNITQNKQYISKTAHGLQRDS